MGRLKVYLGWFTSDTAGEKVFDTYAEARKEYDAFAFDVIYKCIEADNTDGGTTLLLKEFQNEDGTWQHETMQENINRRLRYESRHNPQVLS